MVLFQKDYMVCRIISLNEQNNNIHFHFHKLVIKDKKIAFRGGIGPFQYSIDKVVDWLKEYST